MENKLEKVKDFYEYCYDENGRMTRQPLEFLRCKEIISRYLSKDKMDIADIGGATGSFSYWLAQMNHTVHLLDYTESHIKQAKENGIKYNINLASYTCGDARETPYQDKQFDLVLEMGPLYHLQDRTDRIQCILEAKRILKNEGVYICEVISRYANLFEGFIHNAIKDEKFLDILDENLATGNHDPGDTSYFTTAYFHTPNEIINELKEVGFEGIVILPVEGFANALNNDDFNEDEYKRNMLLKYIRETENIPELLGISSHYMVIGKKS